MRIIGIQHRVKRTAEGASHPTRVAILENNSFTMKELEDEEAELSFLQNLTEGDALALALGGSGDYFAYALARQGDTVGAKVFRAPTYRLKQAREAVEGDKKEDHVLLASLLASNPDFFYEASVRDRALMRVSVAWRALEEAMKARIACEQRLRQNFIGKIFTNKEGLYPEGGIEKAFAEEKASNVILEALKKEEGRRGRELEQALEELDVYTEIFKPIEGMGPRIAGRIISAVGDIRRFETAPKLIKFLGVHVLSDGTFPRRRQGQVANWHGDGRQALYLAADQWNKRPGSHWGKYLRQMKVAYRTRHPVEEIVESGGRKVRKYTVGHIHKMAQWRTMTRFVRHLFNQWKRLGERELEERKAA
jgi:hypothetical protein